VKEFNRTQSFATSPKAKSDVARKIVVGQGLRDDEKLGSDAKIFKRFG
jgi:hypothetical protein